jgi:hypothetical protein
MFDKFPTPASVEFFQRYQQLITDTRSSTYNQHSEYTEVHHILPVSMGGSDAPDNKVILTARDHYEAHYLLWKTFDNQAMAHAFHLMTWNSTDRRPLNSEEYAELRESYVQARKEYWSKLCESEREAHRVKSNSRLKKTGEEILEYNKKLSDAGRSYWKSADERKLEQSKRMKELYVGGIANSAESRARRLATYLDSVSKRTPEERSKLKYSRASGRNCNTIWATDGVVSKRLPADRPLPDGWRKGRLKR